MNAWIIFGCVLVCVLVSVVTDILSVSMWKYGNWYYVCAVLVMAPVVFTAFGYVGHHYGLSVASCLTNSFIVVGPVLVGLIAFKEWKTMTLPAYAGIVMVIVGIALVLFFRKPS